MDLIGLAHCMTCLSNRDVVYLTYYTWTYTTDVSDICVAYSSSRLTLQRMRPTRHFLLAVTPGSPYLCTYLSTTPSSLSRHSSCIRNNSLSNAFF